MPADLPFRSATELTAALRAKEVSSRELLALYLRRIADLDGPVNAVVTLDEEAATTRAAEADEATARGESWGPLHGLPMTIKDEWETAGLRTTAGASELADHVPTRDADAVARVRGAGAVIFGKTNLPPFGNDLQSFNPVFGATSNPWDLARSPAGSSGGAAAALAAGFTGFELGSDIGGSIRTPSHVTGVYGLKTTFGIVPMRGHLTHDPTALAAADLVVGGPMGRSADDLDLGLDVLAGPDAADAVAWRLELPPPRSTTLAGYRVGAWLDDPYCPIETELVTMMQGVVDGLRGEGVTVDESTRPVDLGEAHRLYIQLFGGVGTGVLAQEVYDGLLEARPVIPDDHPDALMVRSATQPMRDWHGAHERRMRMRARWAEYFTDHDVLLCPVTPTAAILHDHTPDTNARTLTVNGRERRYVEQLVWVGMVTAAYLPAAVVPIGRTAAGLPVGLQVVAPHLEDRTAIDVARRIGAALGLGFTSPEGF